jgi:hypothetical protein
VDKDSTQLKPKTLDTEHSFNDPLTVKYKKSAQELVTSDALFSNPIVLQLVAQEVKQFAPLSSFDASNILDGTLYFSATERNGEITIDYRIKDVNNKCFVNRIVVNKKNNITAEHHLFFDKITSNNIDYPTLDTNVLNNPLLHFIAPTGHIKNPIKSSVKTDESRGSYTCIGNISEETLAKFEPFYNQKVKSTLTDIITINLAASTLGIFLEAENVESFLTEKPNGEVLFITRLNEIEFKEPGKPNQTIPGILESVHVLTNKGLELKEISASNAVILGLVENSDEVQKLTDNNFNSFLQNATFAEAEEQLNKTIANLQALSDDKPPYYNNNQAVAAKAQELFNTVVWIKKEYASAPIAKLTQVLTKSREIINHPPDRTTLDAYDALAKEISEVKGPWNKISWGKMLAGSMLVLLGSLLVFTIVGDFVIDKGIDLIKTGMKGETFDKMKQLKNEIQGHIEEKDTEKNSRVNKIKTEEKEIIKAIKSDTSNTRINNILIENNNPTYASKPPN